MKLYADLPGRRTVQILADVGILAWVCLWAWVGRLVHDTTMELAAPGHQLQDLDLALGQDVVEQGVLVGEVVGPVEALLDVDVGVGVRGDVDPARLGYRDSVIVQLTLESHTDETLYEFGRVLADLNVQLDEAAQTVAALAGALRDAEMERETVWGEAERLIGRIDDLAAERENHAAW